MDETADDLVALQALIDRSYASAGEHLLAIHEPARRCTAAMVAERLQGMTLLVLATVTADGRPITGAVDGIFYRGSFYFGSSPDSVRFRHIAARPHVSATHLPGEELAVTVHGRAEVIGHDDPAFDDFRAARLAVYRARFGDDWQYPAGTTARIVAERFYAFHLDPADIEGAETD